MTDDQAPKSTKHPTSHSTRKRAPESRKDVQLNREQQSFLREESDIFSYRNLGHFWELLETRPYMRSRYAVIEATLKVKTFDDLIWRWGTTWTCLPSVGVII